MGIGVIRNFFGPAAAGAERSFGTPSFLRPQERSLAVNVQHGSAFGEKLRQPNAWQQRASEIQEKIRSNREIQGNLMNIQVDKLGMQKRAETPLTVSPNMRAKLESTLGTTSADVVRGVLDETAALLSDPFNILGLPDRAVIHHLAIRNELPNTFPATDSPTYHLTRSVTASAPAALSVGVISGMLFGAPAALVATGSMLGLPLAFGIRKMPED